MPGMDGFQVLEEMRREPLLADIPVILLTATSFVDEALTQRDNRIVVSRPDGLQLHEILRCLQAVIDVLEPRYDERSVPDLLGHTYFV
jgi:CheY-like chemotaxis protein